MPPAFRRRGCDRLTIDLSRGHDHALRRGLTPATGLAPPRNSAERRLAEGSMKQRFRSISRVFGKNAPVEQAGRRNFRLRASRSSPSSIPLGVSRIIGRSRKRESLTRCRNGSSPICPAPIPAWRSTRLPHSRQLSFKCQTRRLPSPTDRPSRSIVSSYSSSVPSE